VTEQNFDSFIQRDATKYHVLLFTEKKTTPAIIKSLSKRYLNKLLIGEVRQSEAELVEKFKVTKFPTLLVVSDSENFQGEVYPGEIKVD
jgi:thioredoxin-related protein